MKKFVILCFALAIALSVGGCAEEGADVGKESENRWICGETQPLETAEDSAIQQSTPEPETGGIGEGVCTPTLTVTCSIDLSGDTYQLSGNPARELLTLLSGLSYDKETCDGLPEYTVVGLDQTRYDLNLSSGWAWMGDKECKLSEDVIADLSDLLAA